MYPERASGRRLQVDWMKEPGLCVVHRRRCCHEAPEMIVVSLSQALVE